MEKMAVPSFNEHLLNMPTNEGEFERSEVSLREVALWFFGRYGGSFRT